MKLKLVIAFLITLKITILNGQNDTTAGPNQNQCDVLVKNMIDALLANNIDLVNSIKASYLIYCQSQQPSLYSANDTNFFSNETNSTNYIYIKLEPNVTRNIYLQQNPVFYLIYNMIDGDALNSIQIDSVLNNTGDLNETYFLTQKYNEINEIVSNLSVSFISSNF
jgi:hypothetical protein